MTRLVRQPFTPGGRFICSRTFKFNGTRYVRGDEFPWRQLHCSVRKLRQLYDGRFLNNRYIEESSLYGSPEEAEDTPEPEEVIETTEEDLDEGPLTVYDPNRHEIVNITPEWFLDLDGVHQLQLTAKEAKRLRKKMEPEEIREEGILDAEGEST